MKVRPSVKPMCEKCKIIRRHGVVQVICRTRATSRGRGSGWHVSPGVNIPLKKRVEIGLTYIYGIGRSTSNKHPRAGRRSTPTPRSATSPKKRSCSCATRSTAALTVEGDLRRERSQNIKRLQEIGCYRGLRHRRGLPVRGQKHQDQRAHAQGPQEPAGARARSRRARSNARSLASSRKRATGGAAQGSQEHPDRPGAHQDLVQQHDRHAHRQRGQRDRLGVRRRRRLQGLAQVDAVRRAGDRRRGRAQGHRARAAEGRGLRQGPGLRPRDGDPLAAGRRPRGHRRQRRDAACRTTAAARASGGGSSDGQATPARSASSAAARDRSCSSRASAASPTSAASSAAPTRRASTAAGA